MTVLFDFRINCNVNRQIHIGTNISDTSRHKRSKKHTTLVYWKQITHFCTKESYEK